MLCSNFAVLNIFKSVVITKSFYFMLGVTSTVTICCIMIIIIHQIKTTRTMKIIHARGCPFHGHKMYGYTWRSGNFLAGWPNSACATKESNRRKIVFFSSPKMLELFIVNNIELGLRLEKLQIANDVQSIIYFRKIRMNQNAVHYIHCVQWSLVTSAQR